VDFVKDLRTRAVAEQTKAANEQHYEVPERQSADPTP